MMRFEFKDGHFVFPRDRGVIFGILNVTPDSFSDGGRFVSLDKAVQHGLALEEDGAHVIDVGGESTRPGSKRISGAEEMSRILPVIRLLKQRLKIPISVDTTKASVAEAALAEGASIINDVSGLSADPRMANVISESKAGVIIMHSRGTPSDMQTRCDYDHFIEDLKKELDQRLLSAINSGISHSQIALDVGIGFAKTAEQNFYLLRKLNSFTNAAPKRPSLDRPLIIGVSRKSFLGRDVADRGPSTLAAELWAYQIGIHMIRTHDVKSIRLAMETIKTIGHATVSNKA
jgi:dihydropteroate synthase